jgi:hypothetical protein
MERNGMDRDEMRRQKEQRDREWLDSIPNDLRPLAEEYMALRREAVDAITAKNRAKLKGEAAKFEELEREAQRLRKIAIDLEARLREELREHKVREFPPATQARARELFLQQDAEFRAAVRPVDRQRLQEIRERHARELEALRQEG